MAAEQGCLLAARIGILALGVWLQQLYPDISDGKPGQDEGYIALLSNSCRVF
jgi:hypothetical protein